MVLWEKKGEKSPEAREVNDWRKLIKIDVGLEKKIFFVVLHATKSLVIS